MPLEAFIVSAARTPVTRRNGPLREKHPADLGAVAVDAAVKKAGCPPDAIDDVIFGCVTQYGAQAANIGRNVVLASKVLPETVPGTSVDRQCGSSQQAIHFAAQAVMSGTQSIVVAGGVEIMSLVPIGASITDAMKQQPSRGNPFAAEGQQEKYGAKLAKLGLQMPSQFVGAELLVRKYKLTREELDASAVQSHARANSAIKEGKFATEIVPVKGKDKDGNPVEVVHDDGVRAGTSLEQLSKLQAVMGKMGGQLTAATSSQISDGAAALVIANSDAIKKYNLKPLAKIHAMAVVGCDPIVMLEGPVFATKKILAQTKLNIKDMDLYEVNEAFASVPLAWLKALQADPAKLNVNGGAMALGHPLGATGARLFTSLIHELQRRKKRYGLVSICEGGGTANATIIENLGAAGSSTSSKL